MHTTLITGVNGFVGHHLAKELHDANCSVLGLGPQPNVEKDLEGIVDSYYQCDLMNPDDVAKLPLEKVDSVINLAAMANVGASFDNPELFKKVNVGVLTGLCNRLIELGKLDTRVLAISTGTIYDSTAIPPFNESSPLLPDDRANPYIISKKLMETEAKKYQEKGLDCVIVRPFNHIGPGQLPGFLLPDLTLQVEKCLEEGRDSIMVGNLKNERDFSDVRDVVHAYRLLATTPKEKLKHGVYNVCSTKPLAGMRILELVMENLGAQDLKIEVDQSKIRPNDPPSLSGDHTVLTQDCGWEPQIPIETTVADFISWHKTNK